MSAKRNITVTVIILLITLVLGVAGIAARQRAETKRASADGPTVPDEGVAVVVATAKMLNVTPDVRASGFLEPYEELTLSAQVSGYVQRQLVEVSDQVDAGATLYRIEDSVHRVALERARAQAERAASELKLAEEQLRRVEHLKRQDSAPPIEVLQVETDLAIAQAMCRHADAAVAEARILLEKTTTRAPMSGGIARIHTRQGEYAHLGQPLLDIIERGRLKLIVQLNDREVVAFEPGDPVTMAVAALPDRVFRGSVLRIHPRATLDSRKFEVEIEVPNPDNALRPGFYVQAELSGRTDSSVETVQAVVVPRMAVFELYRQRFCYVVRAVDGETVERAHRTAIRTAPMLSDMQSVQVLSGVDPGDRVITTGLQQVTHQSIVRAVEE